MALDVFTPPMRPSPGTGHTSEISLRKLQLDGITDGAGWATYISKARKQVIDQLDLNGICVTSQSMSRLAGNHHEIARNRRLVA